MTNVPARRTWSRFPDLSDFFDSIGGLRPALGGNTIRVEDEITDDRYIVRAEMPGLDPETDIDVAVNDGRLEISAERTEKKTENGRSEFSYGSFRRSVTLPRGAKEDEIDASYAKGILTVSVGLGDTETPAKKIEVKKAD
ncbi:Hsp20/alpha crystallin family protein [Rhodococcus chondri]|uniref:Hsp20/alpha crystallin family protein n=1 Tax=Rhodococcus chondri TaxID=3065941 RepID=A0ABU7JPP0_9NOCA|nr:Hsp20/alpha crystallin family protein [Rhodococcus sp. CC-R104]MEE2031999.1 Hsp20/alpha crystallin family protein [Rhodococcus sp. CC-R104]